MTEQHWQGASLHGCVFPGLSETATITTEDTMNSRFVLRPLRLLQSIVSVLVSTLYYLRPDHRDSTPFGALLVAVQRKNTKHV